MNKGILGNLIAGSFLATLGLAVTPLSAETLTIALASEPTSVDPHYHKLTPNEQVASAMFETLVAAHTLLILGTLLVFLGDRPAAGMALVVFAPLQLVIHRYPVIKHKALALPQAL